MAEKLIYEFRVVRSPEGVWLETNYPEGGKSTRVTGMPCEKRAMRPSWHQMKDRTRRRMRKSLDFLEGLYKNLYGNIEN